MPSVPVKPYKSKAKSDSTSPTASTSGNETQGEGGGEGGGKEGSPLDLKDVAEAAEHARLFEGVYQVGGERALAMYASSYYYIVILCCYICVLILKIFEGGKSEVYLLYWYKRTILTLTRLAGVPRAKGQGFGQAVGGADARFQRDACKACPPRSQLATANAEASAPDAPHLV
jgi:hypothetical protein